MTARPPVIVGMLIVLCLVALRDDAPGDAIRAVVLVVAIAGVFSAGRATRAPAQAGLPWKAVAMVIGLLVAAAGLLGFLDRLRVPHSILQPALILPGAAL